MAKSRDGWSNKGIGWVIEKDKWGGDSQQKVKKGPNRPSFVDKRLKYCIKCERVWEYLKVQGVMKHYNDFPSLGKKRELCGECR